MKKVNDTIYDSAWKDVIEGIFPDFILFFFPLAYHDIDWSKGFKFHNKELGRIYKDHEVGNKRVDELVEVYLLDGCFKWLFIHIEVQGYKDNDFLERIYNYRLSDKYKKEIISFAVLSDNNPDYKPYKYETGRWGFKHITEFPIVKLTDYINKLDELEKSENPMSMVVLSSLENHRVKNTEEKFNVKLNLIRKLYKKGYDKTGILSVLRFIDWIITLPPEFEEKIKEEVDKMEGEPMAYVTSFERIAAKKAVLETEKKTALKMLKKNYSPEEIADLTDLTLEEITALKVVDRV